jgi:hypothetical protein
MFISPLNRILRMLYHKCFSGPLSVYLTAWFGHQQADPFPFPLAVIAITMILKLQLSLTALIPRTASFEQHLMETSILP